MDPSLPQRRRGLVIRRADVSQVPWKNGLGITSELAVWPSGTSMDRLDFDWRISAAKVDAGGPFSEFRGYDRSLTITSGAGLRVDHGGHAPRAELSRLEPYVFSGDWPTVAQLVDSAVTDFNVIFRRGRVTVAVEPICIGSQSVRRSGPGPHSFLYVVRGTVRIEGDRDGRVLSLEAGDSFWRQGAETTELEMAAERESADALLVSIG
jgi:environmental stress-induced protein Ves